MPKFSTAFARLVLSSALVAASVLPAAAAAITGTVTLSGSVAFDQPIAGITLDDMTAGSGPGISSTDNGENCDIVANGSADVDGTGLYSSLSVTVEIRKGGSMGGQDPTGSCLLQLFATGNDGAATSAYGTGTILLSVANIQNNEAVAVSDVIVVRQSKVTAGLTKDCLKYTKKQMKARTKCNRMLWTFGGAEGSLKCKEAEEEPIDCDPANYAEEVVAFAHGDMNQQTDPPSALAVDRDVVGDQAKCQAFIGKSSANFVARRNQLVQKRCVEALVDSAACRQTAIADSRAKLSPIDNCVTDVAVDVDSGLVIPDMEEPCRTQCVVASVLDRKCLKECLELELSELSDLIVGDVPFCGNGLQQGAETCDDGNNTAGDCCNATCEVEAAGSQMCGVGACEVTVAQCSAGVPVTCTPGTPGVEAGNCADGIDNDCDGLVDSGDAIDCP
jgi:cysteine-rich repeat protein